MMIILLSGSGFYGNQPRAQGEPFECDFGYAQTVVRHGLGTVFDEQGELMSAEEASKIFGLSLSAEMLSNLDKLIQEAQ